MTAPRTRPSRRAAPTTTEAVHAVIADNSDWPVVSFQTLTVVQAIMADGEVEYRLIRPDGQAEEASVEILAGAIRTFAGVTVEVPCICGTQECTDCLPGGGS